MPYYVPRTRFRKAYPPSFRNTCWESWGSLGSYIGYPLILFGVCLSIIEIVRIIYGPTHRGIKNYDSNDATQFSTGNDFLLFQARQGTIKQRIDKFHYWPWTYAANLFGLVAIAAGIAGIVSATRRSYTSIFSFMTLSLLTALLSGFLIAYYSILINYYKKKSLDDPTKRPDTMDTSWGLIGTNLAFSCATCLFGMAGFVASFLGIRACTPKGKAALLTNNDYSNLSSQNPTEIIN